MLQKAKQRPNQQFSKEKHVTTSCSVVKKPLETTHIQQTLEKVVLAGAIKSRK